MYELVVQLDKAGPVVWFDISACNVSLQSCRKDKEKRSVPLQVQRDDLRHVTEATTTIKTRLQGPQHLPP